ncbi:MAG TPA: ligase-associated DNA damage response exonuclease [Xanthomonadaceae bacterium]|nr:ligase-associated DNA damage response exonuclease [Xanthomonadaceae bacterium]
MPHPHLSDQIPKWQQAPFREGAGDGTARADDLVVLRPEGLYCPRGDFHIDPWLPVPRAVITHGHGDHARPGMGEYHLAREGLPILQWRLGEQRYLPHAYGEPFDLGGVRVSLHPAGHVLGSAQVRIEGGGETWVVSGDYKRQPDPTCAPFEVVPCDVFVTEATFGLPVYRWPDTPEVARDIVAWRDECAARGEAAVLFCYALGKAQRLLAELVAWTDRPALAHGTIAAGVQVYRDCGIAMLATEPVSEPWAKRDYAGELVLAPPSAAGSPWMRRFRRAQHGFASGWMRIRGNRRRRNVDRGFAVSDHADWPALLRTVRETGARRIIATHGNTDPIVRALCEAGIAAESFRTGYGGED